MEAATMLIITRKVGEVIRIGPEIVLRVLEIKWNQIRLGVEAPTMLNIPKRPINTHDSKVAQTIPRRY